MPEVIAAGHLCVDIIPRIMAGSADMAGFLAPGRLTEVGELTLSTGGSVSNTGLALHRLHVDVQLVGRLGEDLIADLTRQILASHGAHLTEHLAIARGEPSSYTIVINPPGIDRTFLHCPGTNNTFGAEDVDEELLAQTRLFHFGYPPIMRRMYTDMGRELAAVLSKAKAAGCTVSLDMAMPDPGQPSGRADWPAILEGALPYVDLFMPSIEELLFMLARPRFDELTEAHTDGSIIDALDPDQVRLLAQEAISLGARIIVIKMGHRGLYLRTGTLGDDLGRGSPHRVSAWRHRELWSPAFSVDVVGTVGAGDATIAGFLTAILRGQSPEAALNSAAAVGACNVEAADAISGVQSWQATQARLEQGWERLDAGIQGPEWEYDQALALWRGPDDRGDR